MSGRSLLHVSDHTDPTTIPNRDLPEALDELLTEAVREATGSPDALPRPGQSKLAHDILRAMVNTTSVEGDAANNPSVGQVLGAAPTGTGKSLAWLAPAMLMALARGQRTVASTESLSLQAQVLDKDAPTVARAATTLYGSAPVTRVLKGWSNFACAAQSAASAAEVLGRDSKKKLGPDQLVELADGVDALSAKQARSKRKGVPKVTVDGEKVDGPVMLPLLSWSLRQHLTENGTPIVPEAGDRHSYPGSADNKTWESVSVTPDACPGAKNCPFGDVCAPTAARADAAEADLVVTNHSMLAVQAARAVPVVLGNRRLGTFDHLVVDEAHTLAGNVRSQGARSISAWRVHGVGKALEKLVVGGRSLDALLESGHKVAERLDLELTALLPQSSRARSFGGGDTVVESLPHTVDPLLQTGEALSNWLRQARAFVPKPDVLGSMKDQVRARRVSSVIAEFLDDIGAAREHRVGQARWVESGRGTGMFNGTAVKLSPVDVSGPMREHLFTADVLPFAAELDDLNSGLLDDDSREVGWALPEWRWCEDPDDSIRKPPRHRLSVTHVSATLATSHRFDNGLDVAAKDYESPFAAAYGASALYVPRAVTPEDLEDLTSRRYGKATFDTSKHADWAAAHVVQLVAANDGSALVLASTVRAGQLYAQHLRSAPATKHLPVFSQWDGPPVRHLLAEWKDNHQAVMVGTKSLMTGVDAPGQTCTLVVVDRNPRAAGNPVDDARVEAVMERAGLDKWSADRHVYVADSALLLTQAAGRLIRCVSQDTELLTSEGWKKHHEVSEGMTIYGVDPEDMTNVGRPAFAVTKNGAPTLRAHKVTGVVVNDTPEPLVSIKAKSLDCLVTPDHKVMMQKIKVNHNYPESKGGRRRQKSTDLLKVEAKDLPSRFVLPLAGRVVRPQSKIARGWFTLLGLIVTDGHVHKVKPTVSLHQSTAKQHVVDEIEFLIERLGLNPRRHIQKRVGSTMSVHGGKEYTRNGDMISWVFSGKDASHIRDALLRGHRRRFSEKKAFRRRSHRGVDGWKDVNRAIPRWIIERAPRPDLLAFVRGLMLGDGTSAWLRGRPSGIFYTGLETEADKFQEIMALVGYRSVKSSRGPTQWQVTFMEEGSVDVVTKDSVTSETVGPTWCVSTELGNMVMRRNGRTFITGNSVNDSGMVAVLDPRLLKSGPLSMKNRSAREDLMAPLGKFATKIADLPLATDWLAEHRASTRPVDDGKVEEGAA